jgi:hypothetical protein
MPSAPPQIENHWPKTSLRVHHMFNKGGEVLYVLRDLPRIVI